MDTLSLLQLNDNKASIQALVSEIMPHRAVLKTEWGEIYWPKDKLPDYAKEQSMVTLEITTLFKEASLEEKRRKILTELAN